MKIFLKLMDIECHRTEYVWFCLNWDVTPERRRRGTDRSMISEIYEVENAIYVSCFIHCGPRDSGKYGTKKFIFNLDILDYTVAQLLGVENDWHVTAHLSRVKINWSRTF